MKNEINTLTSYFLLQQFLSQLTSSFLSRNTFEEVASPWERGKDQGGEGVGEGGRVLLRIATELTMFGLQFQKSY